MRLTEEQVRKTVEAKDGWSFDGIVKRDGLEVWLASNKYSHTSTCEALDGETLLKLVWEQWRGVPSDTYLITKKHGVRRVLVPIHLWEKTKTIDWENTDRAYWIQLFHEVEFGTYVPAAQRGLATSPHKWLKQRRFLERQVKQANRIEASLHPVTLYGEEIGTWLLKKLAEISADDDCVDNARWAETTSNWQKRHYKKRKKTGCCGSTDVVVRHLPTGRRFHLGFNYGH